LSFLLIGFAISHGPFVCAKLAVALPAFDCFLVVLGPADVEGLLHGEPVLIVRIAGKMAARVAPENLADLQSCTVIAEGLPEPIRKVRGVYVDQLGRIALGDLVANTGFDALPLLQ